VDACSRRVTDATPARLLEVLKTVVMESRNAGFVDSESTVRARCWLIPEASVSQKPSTRGAHEMVC